MWISGTDKFIKVLGVVALVAFGALTTGQAQQPAGVSVALEADAETEALYREQLEVFMQENPDVEVELLIYPTEQYPNAIQLLFQSDDAPDIYRTGGQATTQLPTSHQRGWVRPLDEFITEAYKARFPEEVFDPVNSGRYIGGEIYGIPFVNARWPLLRPLFYNADLLREYGFDGPPETWNELRSMAAAITEQGNGRVYGLASFGENIDVAVGGLAQTAGSGPYIGRLNTPINRTTGEPAAADPALVAAVELVKEMNAEGTLTPGWETWGNDQMFQQFALERLAMFVGSSWQAAEIRALNPDINMDFAPVPVPDEGRGGYSSIDTQNTYWVMSSQTENPEAAWQVLDFFTSVEFQRAFFRLTGTPVAVTEAYEGVDVPEDTARLITLAEKTLRVAPNRGSKHPDAETLIAAISTNEPQPLLRELMLLAITRNEPYLPMAEAYDQEVEQVIEEQIGELQEAGSDITKDALSFPDYDPLQDYNPGVSTISE